MKVLKYAEYAESDNFKGVYCNKCGTILELYHIKDNEIREIREFLNLCLNCFEKKK